MKPRPLTLLAGAVFAVSYFLPSYENQRGYQCFLWCWSMLLDVFNSSEDPLLSRLYYPTFVLTNVLFVAIAIAGLASAARFFRTRFFLCALAFFHVVSWLVLNVTKDSFSSLMPGYYVWLAAYGLLLAALLAENKKSSAA